MNGPQGAPSANFTTALEVCATHAAHMIGQMRKQGQTLLEPTLEAENAYCNAVYEASGAGLQFYATCTPGYYNNEGNVAHLGKSLSSSYPGAQPGNGGTDRFIQIRKQEREQGTSFKYFNVA